MYSAEIINQAKELRKLYGDKWTRIARELGISQSGIKHYFYRNKEQVKQKEEKMFRTLAELSNLFGIPGRDIRQWVLEGKLNSQKQERQGYGFLPKFRYLVDEGEFREFLRLRKQGNRAEALEKENNQNTKREWIIENTDKILSHFLACNNREDTTRHFGLNAYYLCVAFHIAGRDDLVQPCRLKNITNAYPLTINPPLPELMQRTLIPQKPTGNNFHANLIAFFKEVEQNDKIIIEQQKQLAELTIQYNNSKEEGAKLRSIIVQAKEMMARGD